MNNAYSAGVGGFNPNRGGPEFRCDCLLRAKDMTVNFSVPARSIVIVLLLLFLALLSLSNGYSLDVPPIEGHINDYAQLLSPAQKTEMESLLSRFEKQSTYRVAIITIPSLEGEEIEPYSLKIAEAWNVREQGKENWVLLAVAPVEGKVRIEVGNALQGRLTGAKRERIIRKAVLPRLRENDYYGGLADGIRAIIAEAGEKVGGTDRVVSSSPRPENMLSVMFIAFLISGMIGLISWLYGGLAGAGLGAGFAIFWGMTLSRVLSGLVVGGCLGLISPLLLRFVLKGAMNPSGRGGWYRRTRGWNDPGVGGGWGGFSAGGGSFGGGGD
ncbi:MAG TPA: TPM domain-containing protein [Nitrospiria bacterium]|nr:TPM domain-containing protein [Nitrospiria bacterium]